MTTARLKRVVAGGTPSVEGTPNSVIDWFYVRALRGHMFGNSMNVTYYVASMPGSSWLCDDRHAVLLQCRRVALAPCTIVSSDRSGGGSSKRAIVSITTVTYFSSC